MNHLPAILRRFLDVRNASIRSFSLAVDVHDGHMAQVLKGSAPLSHDNLVKIVEVIMNEPRKVGLDPDQSRPFACSLIVAWLRDKVPADFEDYVSITADAWTGVQEIDAEIDPRAAAIAFFDRLSQEQPSVADWLISTKAVIQAPKEVGARLASARLYRENHPTRKPGNEL